MHLKERIGFFVRDGKKIAGLIVLLGTVLLCFAYCMSDAKSQEEKEAEIQTEEQICTVNASGEEKLYSFYLYGEEGYLNVYDGERKKVLIHTSIPVDSLPGELQQKIRQGLGIQSEKELYGFLENYSS